jgi:peptidoglycan/xylan/chitin deacetylase (PgdA/CDA1 family)
VTPPRINTALKASIIVTCTTPGQFALTYDDGPSINIPALLTKLDELKVKATFFVNGKNYGDITSPTSSDAINLKSIFDKGHQVGTHTYSHADLSVLNNQQIWDQLRSNDIAIRNIICKRPTHLRPPYLATSTAMLNAVGTYGYKVVGINLDTRYYEHSGLPNEVALNHQSVDGTINGSNSATASFIALDHDFTKKIVQWTDELVKQVQTKGYKLVTTAQCIGDTSGGYRA